MPSNNFCRRPFTDLSIEPNGIITPCCLIHISSEGRKKFRDRDLDAYLGSDSLSELQAAFNRNERPPECSVCWSNEREGGGSLRINRPPRDAVGGGSFTEVHIKTSSVCNFKCRICHPYSSSTWLTEQRANGFTFDDLIEPNTTREIHYAIRDKSLRENLLTKVLPSTKMIRISGGEPLICSDTLAFMRDLINRRLENKHYLLFTNLSVLKFAGVDYLDFWKNFPHLRLIVSCDGAGESVEYSRTGFKWKTFLENLRLVKDRISAINCVISIYSVYSIPDLAQICEENSLDLNIEPEFRSAASLQILSREEKEKIEDFYLSAAVSRFDGRLTAEMTEMLCKKVFADLRAADRSDEQARRKFRLVNDELDRRRGTKFIETFPRYANWYDSINISP
jgi:MoaA/NifB/PqqE/SkfB family radical SAM enzyme